MKLVTILACLLLCSCQLTGRLDEMSGTITSLVQTVEDLHEDDEGAQDELKELRKQAKKFQKESDALRADLKLVEDAANGVLGLGTGGDAGAAVTIGGLILNYIRNRKYVQPGVKQVHGSQAPLPPV